MVFVNVSDASAVGRRTPSKSGTPHKDSNRRLRDQKITRRAKDKSGDLDDIDKLFLDGDLDSAEEVDGIDEQTGEWVKYKVAEEEVAKQGAFDERPEKDVIVSRSHSRLTH